MLASTTDRKNGPGLLGQSGDFAGTRGKGETRRLQPFFMGRIIAELRHQLAVISAERNEPRPLDLQGRRTVMITVSHRGVPIRMAWSRWRPMNYG